VGGAMLEGIRLAKAGYAQGTYFMLLRL
jgi:hypothetical protein